MTFKKLNEVNVSGATEKKGKFTYLSWPWAWAEVKKVDPGATYRVLSTEDGTPYFACGSAGAFVKVGVTVNGLEHVETFPVLNHSNKPIPSDKVNVFDVNTSIKRGMVKAIAMHGLGLYIYAGEDLPTEAPKRKPKMAPAPVAF